MIRKTRKKIMTSNNMLNKLITTPFKSNAQNSTGINRTMKMRTKLVEEKDKLLHKRTLSQIQRSLNYYMNEVKRLTMSLFKKKMNDIIYERLVSPKTFVTNNYIVPFKDMKSLKTENDYLFPNYYNLKEVYNLCENANYLTNFINTPLYKENRIDKSGTILKKYMQNKRYNYHTNKFIDVISSKTMALQFKNNYHIAIELTNKNYDNDTVSLLTPFIYIAYSTYDLFYSGVKIQTKDNIDLIIENISHHQLFIANHINTKDIIEKMDIVNWYDYNTNINHEYIEFIHDIQLLKKRDSIIHPILYNMIIANRVFITHYVCETRKYRHHPNTKEYINYITTVLLKILHYYLKYKYLFFGETFHPTNGFVKTNKPIVTYCSNIHGKDIIIGYLVYKYCYDECIKDIP